MNNAIFYKPKHLWRALICMCIALALFCLSVFKTIEPFRVYLDNFTNRIFIFNYGTNQIVNHITPNFKDVGSLTSANEQLQRQVTALQSELSRVRALEEENKRLKAILGINDVDVAYMQAVNLINTEQGVKNNIIFIDKGAQDGLFYGQNIFDAYGLIGQIISVSDNQSRVLMITDVNSYVPVYNLSNQEQYLLKGSNSQELEVEFIKPKSEIKVGDRLYTSGLAQRFLSNYPVAQVTRVVTDSNNNVIRAYAQPLAHLTSLRYMVAVWPYCNIMPTQQSPNLVYNREYNHNSLLQRLEQNRKSRTTNFLYYQYRGVSPESLSFAQYLTRLKGVSQVVDTNYQADTNLGRQHCYTINPTRPNLNRGGNDE